MASKKRAADGDVVPAKKKHSSEDRASKRLKKSDSTQLEKLVKEANDEKKPVQNGVGQSLLSKEDKAFPRGGASVLTPLEHKQIQNQAVRDVLFEQSGNKRPIRDEIDGEEIEEEDEGSQVKKGHKKRQKYKAAIRTKEEKEEPKIRVEGLNFKRLVPGSLVLGQIVQITTRDIVLALPNNLVGYVPLTAISDQLTAKVEKLLAADPEADDDEDEDDDFEDVDLKKMFKIGQYLRAYVISNGNEQPGKSKRRIELAINPRHANFGLEKGDLVRHITVQASVTSVEDHGAVMDLGLQDTGLKAFLAFKELGQAAGKEDLQEGTVLLCQITSSKDGGSVIKLSADLNKAGELTKSNFLDNAPTVNAFLPGTGVDVLITDVSRTDIVGKVMGMVDTTADHIHSGHPSSEKELTELHKIGDKVKARIIFTFPKANSERIGISILPDVLALASGSKTAELSSQLLPHSSIVEEAVVKKIDRKLGLFLDVGIPGYRAFAHISRLTEKKLDSLSEDEGSFKLGSKHRARIIGFNPVDGLFLASLEKSVLDQPFLRVDDIEVGSRVKGTVERLVVNDRGVGGVLVNLADGISGLVPEIHMADVHLQHPDRKFREGMTVNARVLSTDPEKRLVRLTLKKSLVNSDVEPWTSYESISVGAQAPGTIINIVSKGAVIQFYGKVRAFLPVSEMSEAFIKDPSEHFKVGQVVNVRVLNIDTEEKRCTVSCKQESSTSKAQAEALERVKIGEIVSGTVVALTAQNIELELDSGVKAVLSVEHLTDGSEKKNASALKKIRASQKLQDLLVLEKNQRQKSLVLSNKPSLVKAARNGALVKTFEDLEQGKSVDGFVRNINGPNVFVQFANGLTGLLHRSQLSQDIAQLSEYGLRVGQSLTARVLDVEPTAQKFRLTMKSQDEVDAKTTQKSKSEALVNPVDGVSTTMSDFSVGNITKVRITSIKDTQLNVALAENIQGRVDMSEVFSNLKDIPDRKKPLQSKFKNDQVIDVKIMGFRDTRNHRWLPITHRTGGNVVFELSVKAAKANDAKILEVRDLKAGSSYLAFVNNHEERSIFVTLSPKVRARLDLMELTDDVSLLDNLAVNFPIGSALKVTVKSVDTTANRVELTARNQSASATALTFQDLKKGMILPARVTKLTDSYMMVQLNDTVSGQVPLTELADDFDTVKPVPFKKNDIVRVCVLDVDLPNKKLTLSTRPSLTISSSLPTKDRHVESASQLKVNDLVRGFVGNVADVGLFVRLGPSVTAFVKVANLSDSYLKDWKAKFQVDQLVQGKVIEVDPGTKKVMLSLKPSHIENDYTPPVGWSDVKKGDVVTAKVRRVEDFGVFIVVDNSNNVSGLCHRSEIADSKVEDVKKLYTEGDKVKAVVLKIDAEKRKAAFGLKTSYFGETQDDVDENDDSESNSDVEMGGVQLVLSDDSDEEDDEDDDDAIVDLANVRNYEDDGDEEDEDSDVEMDDRTADATAAQPGLSLTTGGFDWSGEVKADKTQQRSNDSDDDNQLSKKKRKSKTAQIQIDRTGDLDAHGPQSVADYERLLLGTPNDSALWVQYMAFQVGLSEVEKAREVAERALKTIHIRETEEKKNVWIAWLNLEVTFGEEDKVDEVFQRACQYNDRGEMHEKLANIYVEAGKPEKATPLFTTMQKIKPLNTTPSFWLNAATFHLTTLNQPTQARQLLQRALQSVPAGPSHRELTTKFALLEFTSPNGDVERGRTVFEGLIGTFPKRWDLWDCWVDAELALLGKKAEAASAVQTRDLFRRMGGAKGMRPRRARYVFKRWREFEERYGDKKGVQGVEGAAREWVERHEREKGGEEEA